MPASLTFECPKCGHRITLFVKPSANPTHQCKPTIRNTYVMKPV